MKKIAIYVEGGGNAAHERAQLRTGLDALLQGPKEAARRKRLQWKTIPSGGRSQTFAAFWHAFQTADEESRIVLLVDAEGPLPAESKGQSDLNARVRKQHLTARDGWDLTDVPAEQVHLMVQCMEAWIVADPEALAAFYGKGFHAKQLPVRANLEDEPKPELYGSLCKATRRSKSGEYGKIRHASKLLALIAPTKVASRCPRFATFTGWLTEQIEAA